MLWLALIWVALIAVWGASEHWDLLGAGRRVAQSIHHRGRSDGLPPLD